MQQNIVDVDLALKGLCNEDYSLIMSECKRLNLPEFSEQFANLCQIDDEDERLQLSARVAEDLLNSFPEESIVFHRFNLWVDKVSKLRQDLRIKLLEYLPDLEHYGEELDQISTTILRTLELQSYRFIRIEPGGVGATESIKAANMLNSIEKLATMLAGIAVNVGSLLAGTTPIYYAALMWLNLTIIRKATTQKISERDATVFWGLITAASSKHPDYGIDEAEIIRITNSERVKYGYNELPPEEIRRSLKNLEKVRTIELSRGMWQIREGYKIAE